MNPAGFMWNNRKIGVAALGAVSAACAIGVLAAAPANAAATAFKDHQTAVPVAGEVFHCTAVDLTVTGGTIDSYINGVQDAQGVLHVTGTIVPHDVTLTDGTNSYYISGAGWFGLTGTDPDNGVITVATDTEHFVIRAMDGGVYAKVQFVEHLSPNGGYFQLDTGACQTPVD
jgi:hypothetical protein